VNFADSGAMMEKLIGSTAISELYRLTMDWAGRRGALVISLW